MKNITFILIIIFSSGQMLAEENKPLKDKEIKVKNIDRNKVYKDIEKQINKIKNEKDREALKKDIRDAEMRILRKSKEVEQVFHERNKDRPAVKEFFEFKDKITTKKTINGEEFEVLKNLEPLRDQFLKERKKILEAYRAKHRREVREVDTFTQETESNIQYPLPTSKNSLIGGTPYNPKHQDITFSESDNQPRPIKWLFGLGIFLAVALVTFFYLKKRTPKE